jgi:hypothetical protein
MKHWLVLAALGLACATCRAQDFGFPSLQANDDRGLSVAMPRLAREVIDVYHDDDRATDLDNRFRLQMVAGNYADAAVTLDQLRALPSDSMSPQARVAALLYEVLAKTRESSPGADALKFAAALQDALRETLATLDDRESAMAVRALGAQDADSTLRAMSSALQTHRGDVRLPLTDALALIKTWHMRQSFRDFEPLAPTLAAEEDRKRYLFDNDLKIRTPDGATVCALVVRPRAPAKPLPALLVFTIYYGPFNIREARRSASNGYVGVVGFPRGIGCSPDAPVAYEHDGADADALIEWISRQPWSDGRVGMYGGSYAGFTQWAALKRRPKALQAIMPSATGAPGIDTPMEGGVHQSFSYY